MANRLERDILISASLCDHRGQLSIPACFELFMDSATEHAETIGAGMHRLMEKGLFWIAAKTMVEINKPLRMMDRAVLSTWPMPPERVRCDREYCIEKEGELIARGKAEWAVLNMNTGRIVPPASVFPEGIVYDGGEVFPEPFDRFPRDFSSASLIGTHRIVSTDLDLGGHMNHVAYIRALFSCFSSRKLDEAGFGFAEAHYRAQSYEGDILSFLQTEDPERGLVITAVNQEEKPVFTAALR